VTEPGAPDDDDGDVETHHVVVGDEQAGERIDAVIAAHVATLSRAVVQRLIEDGHVALNGAPAKKSGQRVKLGDAIDVDVPVPEPIELVAEDIPVPIVFEDADIVVVDKPAGLVVHPAAGHPRGTLVNALLFHCKDLGGIGGVLRPGIVHRLDKDTSGVMVVAKTDRAHAALTAAFAAKVDMLREYFGIAAPPPPSAAGTLRTFHNRHPTDRKRFSSRVMWGKSAVTHWTTEQALDGAALVRFRLETGRTHQIRVHAADHGWPLLGDVLYGKPPAKLAPLAKTLGRQALHAAVLELVHPATGTRMRFTSPLPDDMRRVLTALGGTDPSPP
jgi:23S rRNA pseudouridine1911/1915/1917 synthase